LIEEVTNPNEEIRMPENPAELPAEGEGGGGIRRRPIGIGGPQELPPSDWNRISIAQLVSEVFQMRDRIHVLEGAMLAARLGGGAAVARSLRRGIGGPNELPEGEGEGGSIGRVRFPGEIHEINEIPANRFATEFANFVARFTQFEKNVTQQLAALTQRMDAKR
jgi:hypothetical protein